MLEPTKDAITCSHSTRLQPELPSQLLRGGREEAEELTQTRVDEAVPHAACAPEQPAALRAGGEAEGGPQRADQQVAGRDAHQQQVHGRAQRPVAAEQRQHQQVAEEAEGADEAEAHGDHQVPPGAEAGGRQGRLPGRVRG